MEKKRKYSSHRQPDDFVGPQVGIEDDWSVKKSDGDGWFDLDAQSPLTPLKQPRLNGVASKMGIGK